MGETSEEKGFLDINTKAAPRNNEVWRKAVIALCFPCLILMLGIIGLLDKSQPVKGNVKIKWRILALKKEIKYSEEITFRNLSENSDLALILSKKGFSKLLHTNFIKFDFKNAKQKNFKLEVRFDPKKFSFQVLTQNGILPVRIGEGPDIIEIISDSANYAPAGFSLVFYSKK